MNETKEETKIEQFKKHAIIYTDGSCINNPSMEWGSGYHGYIYTDETLNKKSGDRPSKFMITTQGYLDSSGCVKQKHETVIPDTYINGYYSSGGVMGSNNTGELQAIINMVLFGIENKLNTLKIMSDSTYALGWLDKMNKRNYSFEQEDRPNHEYIYALKNAVIKATEIGLVIVGTKVQAHSTDMGNNIADQLALLGRLISTRKHITENKIILTPNIRYWKSSVVKNALINYRSLYFLNGNDATTKGKYAVLNYKKDVEPGRKSHEANFGYVVLGEPVELIENVKHVYQSYLKDLSLISAVDTDMLFNQNTDMLYRLFGNDIFTFNTRGRRHLSVLEEDIVCSEIYPPGLAKGALDKIIMMQRYIDEYRNKTMSATRYTDITDKVYTIDDKGKTVIKLDTLIKSIDIEYLTKDHKPVTIVLELGKDTISRNQFKKLEKLDPVVILVTNELSNNFIEYYIIVETQKNNDIGIYCNYFSNGIYH